MEKLRNKTILKGTIYDAYRTIFMTDITECKERNDCYDETSRSLLLDNVVFFKQYQQ